MDTRQRIQIGDGNGYFELVVRNRRTVLPLGIETGYIELRSSDVPVWRPINPASLGVDNTHGEGLWRNIYIWVDSSRGSNAQTSPALTEFEVAGKVVSLPSVDPAIAPALGRFLRQYLR